MLSSLPPYLLYLLTAILSAVISMYAVKKTIFITGRMKIYDVPDRIRKIHGAGIPSMGGIGIFTGFIIVALLSWPKGQDYLPALLSSSALLFFTGFYDDLTNMRPAKKLLAQLIASFMLVYFANLRMRFFFLAFDYDVLFAYDWLDVILTTLSCTFFVNVFNFIDGIDGLACALGILYMGVFGGLFAYIGNMGAAAICFTLMGATSGLLYYNVSPAKIYMGDTGSMFLGFNAFCFSLLFLEYYFDPTVYKGQSDLMTMQQVTIFFIALLILPIYDGIRVFVLRGMKGISPLKADRRHLHYYLLDAGCTHTQAVGVIVLMNVVLILLAWLLQDVHIYIAILGCIVLVSGVVMVVYRMRARKMR
ncbi:MAG: undecaprenyl/decaprenyl-phosphate alpha-N-acetylglucosaminyl 1-phosphate transferase [Flavipsychrobacter sp.]|jgi:UDP-N-acetylmuramyl pentapeptide phosphotransferase/UDP-N-acetylglucosamine-1-phosphate transferase|nr:undecaprenyl/decaprenyl-phosphate alpha-N-acetylglucosaminyl 1-phosphate transferase [Flavipsychrobacter sp.]